jgi:hypothetical protein
MTGLTLRKRIGQADCMFSNVEGVAGDGGALLFCGASRGSHMLVTLDEETDIQEFIKDFPSLPEEEKVPRYWIGSLVVTIIVVVGFAAFSLGY